MPSLFTQDHLPRQRYSDAVVAASIVMILALSSHADSAPKQAAGTITLSIGSAPAGTQFNDTIQIPVLLTSQSGSPATIFMFVEFETGKLEFLNARLGPEVPADRELFFFVDEDPLVTTISMGTIDLQGLTPVPDGVIFLLDFRVLSTVPNDMIPIIADEDSSAANINAESFTIILENGSVDLSCPFVQAPVGVQAGEGDPDGVTVTWSAVAGLSEYRVFRSVTTGSSGAVPVSDWIMQTTFFDATADPPRIIEGSGCSDPTTMLVTYYYFVKSRLSVNCESGFSLSDAGSRGTAGTKLYEKALPLRHAGEAYRLVDGVSPIYLRLSADETIDPDSIWGEVVSARGTFSNVAWQPIAERNASDGWLVFQPQRSWISGDIITMTGGGLTRAGDPVGPVSVEFLAVDFVSNNDRVAPTTSDPYPELENAISIPFAIGPEQAYAEPLHVLVPISELSGGADGIAIYYFDGAVQRWRQADQVHGWLASEATIEYSEGNAYVEFLANHGAIVRIVEVQPPTFKQASWLAPLNQNVGTFTPLMLAMFTLLILGRRQRSSDSSQP